MYIYIYITRVAHIYRVAMMTDVGNIAYDICIAHRKNIP